MKVLISLALVVLIAAPAFAEEPPPAAPPLIPKTGPKEGSRRTTTAFFPNLFNPSFNPIEVVVFPSPAGVGVMAVTRMRQWQQIHRY